MSTWQSNEPDAPSGKVFSLNPMTGRTPTITNAGNTTMLTRAELDHPSCPSCYRPTSGGYCASCVTGGHALRHRTHPDRQADVEGVA